MDEYIYIITHHCAYILNNEHTQKIGSTRNPICRFATYKTYYPRNIIVHRLYKINCNCYMVDNMIKKEFTKYNVIDNGGIEFYSPQLTPNMLENFFNKMNIIFEIIDPKTINYSEHKLTKFDKYYIVDEDNEIEFVKNLHVCKPKDYQASIIDKVCNHFNDNKKGTIIMACGTGKSLTAYWICVKLNCKKILVLVPSLYLLDQLGKNFIDQAYAENKQFNFCFIGSDLNIPHYKLFNRKEKDKIKKFIDDNNDFIMFSTYQSCDILKNFSFDLIIFDEAHRTASIPKIKNNTADDESKLMYSGFNIMVSQYNANPNVLKLFMTATEKICNNAPNDDNIEVISMDNENLYGKVLHHLSIRDAINLNALCNYKIIIHQEDIDNLQIPNLDHINFKNKIQYYAKSVILKKSSETYGLNHIITKHSTCQNAYIFSKLLSFVMNKEFKIFYIDGKTSIKKRNNIIQQFIDNKYAIICQAEVMKEGVNLIICDTVYPVDEMESSIDILQFLGRMLRLFPSKKMAYMILPMLTSKNEDIINEKKEYNNVRLIARAISYEDETISNYFKYFNTEKYKTNLTKKNDEQNCPVIFNNSNGI